MNSPEKVRDISPDNLTLIRRYVEANGGFFKSLQRSGKGNEWILKFDVLDVKDVVDALKNKITEIIASEFTITFLHVDGSKGMWKVEFIFRE